MFIRKFLMADADGAAAGGDDSGPSEGDAVDIFNQEAEPQFVMADGSKLGEEPSGEPPKEDPKGEISEGHKKGQILDAGDASDVNEDAASETPQDANVLDELLQELTPPSDDDEDDLGDDDGDDETPQEGRASSTIKKLRKRAQAAEQKFSAREEQWQGWRNEVQGVQQELNNQNQQLKQYIQGLQMQMQQMQMQSGRQAEPEDPQVTQLKKTLGLDGLDTKFSAYDEQAQRVERLEQELARRDQEAAQQRKMQERQNQTREYNQKADRAAQYMLRDIAPEVQETLQERAARLLLGASVGRDFKTAYNELHQFSIQYVHALSQARLRNRKPSIEQGQQIPNPKSVNAGRAQGKGRGVLSMSQEEVQKAGARDHLDAMLKMS